MSAISTTMLEFLQPGDLLLYSTPLYGGSIHFIEHVLTKFGIHVLGFKAGHTHEELIRLVESSGHAGRLGMIFIETPANPTNSLIDIEFCKQLAKRFSTPEREVVVAVDNTYMGPLWQHPLKLGADLVLYSATKYLGGHSDVIAGACLGAKAHITRIKTLRTFLGNMAGPWTGWLLMRSLETLKPRMETQAKNAAQVAHFLREHPLVEKVHYLGFITPGGQGAVRHLPETVPLRRRDDFVRHRGRREGGVRLPQQPQADQAGGQPRRDREPGGTPGHDDALRRRRGGTRSDGDRRGDGSDLYRGRAPRRPHLGHRPGAGERRGGGTRGGPLTIDPHAAAAKAGGTLFVVAALLLAGCGGRKAPRAVSSLAGNDSVRIFDHHVHVMSPALVERWKSIGVPFSKPDYAYSDIDSILKFNPADRMFLISMAYLWASPEFSDSAERSNVARENDFVAGLARKHPEKLFAFCGVNPLTDYAAAELLRCRNDLGMYGLKLHFASSGVSLNNADHLARVREILSLAADQKMPVVLHFDNQTDTFDAADVDILIDSVLAQGTSDGTLPRPSRDRGRVYAPDQDHPRTVLRRPEKPARSRETPDLLRHLGRRSHRKLGTGPRPHAGVFRRPLGPADGSGARTGRLRDRLSGIQHDGVPDAARIEYDLDERGVDRHRGEWSAAAGSGAAEGVTKGSARGSICGRDRRPARYRSSGRDSSRGRFQGR